MTLLGVTAGKIQEDAEPFELTPLTAPSSLGDGETGVGGEGLKSGE